MIALCLILGILLLPVSSPVAQDFQFPDIPGWKQSGEIQTFSPKTLYEYINGAADLYLASDFEELKVAEYGNEKKASVIVEAYRHRTPRDAFGIYSQERLPDGDFVTIGAQGYIDHNILNFVYENYYIKLNGFNTGAEDREILPLCAKKRAENPGETGGLPPLLSAFPSEGKKDNSEKYITRNFLGYTFFNSAYTADYEIAGKRFKLFLIEAADKNECKSIIQKYFRQIKNPEREVTEGRYTVSDPHHGMIDLFWKGAYIWGAVDLADADLRSKVLKSFDGNITPGK
ncbi:MAG: hypothetical protein Q8K00_20170 [Syntrophales bacterium]|nr:hypothetical protein [Syntrophales bacterium]